MQTRISIKTLSWQLMEKQAMKMRSRGTETSPKAKKRVERNSEK
jgi:hypothetical protein